METISVVDENGKVYEFEKPDFECELLKVLFDHNNKAYIIGYSLDVRKELGYPYPKTWTIDGKCYDDDDTLDGDFNLTPIKPKWYEDESNFPALLITNSGSDEFYIETFPLSAGTKVLIETKRLGLANKRRSNVFLL